MSSQLKFVAIAAVLSAATLPSAANAQFLLGDYYAYAPFYGYYAPLYGYYGYYGGYRYGGRTYDYYRRDRQLRGRDGA